MHKYNNADHSMLTAMVAVDNIAAGVTTKENLWAINTEQEYHEEKSEKRAKSGQTIQPSPKRRQERVFIKHLLHDKLHKRLLWIAGLSILLQFIFFKILYPFASFINGDSYVYLQSALLNPDINTFPIGYPKFLRLISVFTKSDTALVAIQYLSILLSALYFLFTFFYIYSPTKPVKWLLFLFIVFNPGFLYLSNLVSSDAIFLALSLTWFTQLLWIIRKPSPKLIILNALLLVIAFSVRLSALYYPLVAAIAFALSSQSLARRLISIGLNIFFMGSFMLYTSYKYQEYVGIKEFTPFTGWQLANNALYAYRYVNAGQLKKVPPRFEKLDKSVRTYFDTTKDVARHPAELLLANTVYMWDPKSPLVRYMNNQFKIAPAAEPERKWATMAPLYAAYGSWLIQQYPGHFIEFYLWPNLMKYYTPPKEFLEQYNGGADTVYPIAKFWFGYKTNKVRTAFKDSQITILNFIPILDGAVNVILLLGLPGIFLVRGIPKNKWAANILLLAGGFWLINFGFSVISAPVTLRYQIFPIIITTSFALLLLSKIYNAAFVKSSNRINLLRNTSDYSDQAIWQANPPYRRVVEE
jgi:hypothetical protein